MTTDEMRQKAMDALVTMNTAIKNLRLYPATSAMIVQTIDKLNDAFQDLLADGDALIFAESERSLLIGGEVLPPKDQEKPAVIAFLDLMLNFGVRSITFERGISKEELTALVDLLSKKPEAIGKRGGLQALLSEGGMEHIVLNRKVYVASDHGRQIMTGLDIQDDQIIRYLAEAYPDKDIDPARFQDMARDANWLKRVFQAGMTEILKQRGKVDDTLLSERLARLLAILDKVADKADQESISQDIGKSIADLDPELLRLLLMQKIQDALGGNLYQCIISQIDDAKYEALSGRAQPADGEAPIADTRVGPAVRSDGSEDQSVMKDTGEQAPRRARIESAPEEQGRKKRAALHLLNGQIQKFLTADEGIFLDPAVTDVLPDAIRELSERGDLDRVDALIEKTVDGLFSEDPQVRERASASLVDILDGFPAAQQGNMLRKPSKRLMEWIHREETAFRSYKTICMRLKDLIAEDIRKERYAEALPLLDTFNRIYSGVLEKNDAIHGIAVELIDGLASKDLVGLLFGEFKTDAKKKRAEAGRVLARLGDVPLNRLMEMLREHSDSNERVQILQLITDIGPAAVPVIRARIREDEPWYYLRNLAYLLGRVGNEATINALEPLLLHTNNRVRQEALKSVQRIGGSQRGPLLLSVLPRIDDAFKINVIEVLGTIQFNGAVQPLIRELKNRPLIASSFRADLEEKICTALGQIGAPEAIPALSEVSRSGGFFSVRSYPEKARNAAGKALASIRRRQAEAER